MRVRHLIRFVIAAVATISLSGISIGQDEDQQQTGESVEMMVIGGDELGGAPMIFQTTESFDGGETRTGMRIMSAGPGVGNMAFFGGEDFVMPAPEPWDMINDPSVQKDLELVGDQLKQVQDLQSQFAKQMKEKIGDVTKGGLNKEGLKDLPALIEKMKAQQREQMEGMLLPHQIARLQQVALQTHLNRAGTANALASDKVAEALGITNEQIERLKKRSKEINEQLAKDTKALQEKAKAELLNELSTDQRDKLKEMTGDKFEPQSGDWESSFRNSRRPRTRRSNRDN